MRARFTLAEIQRHALSIVDQHGLTGLTMRSLAAALGTGPMTLYNYVDGREALEGLVVDAVAAEVETPDSTEDWLADVRAVATALWRAVRAHPATVPLVLTRRTSSATGLAPAEALAAALARGGLHGADLLVAFRVVMAFVMGVAQSALAGPLAVDENAEAAAERVGALARDSLPALAGLASIGAEFADVEFERGLAIVLAGVASTTRST